MDKQIKVSEQRLFEYLTAWVETFNDCACCPCCYNTCEGRSNDNIFDCVLKIIMTMM